MAEQHKVARHVSESFVGRTLKVLVEGEADAKQLKAAKVSSWEHGLVREHDSVNLQTRPELVERTRNSKTLLVARGEADAPDIDGRVYIKGRMPVGEFGRVRIVGHTDYDLIAEPSDA
jgi:ribosomal protein S12 methylthiotransferase